MRYNNTSAFHVIASNLYLSVPCCFQVLMSAMLACPWPLYANVLMKDAVTWRSSLDVDEMVLPDSVEAAVSGLLDGVEQRLGAVFVSHALGFITVVNDGLCEVGETAPDLTVPVETVVCAALR